MASRTSKRIPEVKTLYEMLPKGTEGGKEFARVVDLLRFHEARKSGRKITLFSDVAGDYYGLDSFEGDVFRQEGTTGFQYKFYPSPLSATHRKSIEESLVKAGSSDQKLKLRKWVLITPQDFIESATRKDGGDVRWFEGLRGKLGLEFQLEHVGHRQLVAMFLETRSLCLFYYPELTGDSFGRKTIEQTRGLFDENLAKLNRNIEFVGMSVYKPEAVKGVPMEHIYIPVTAVPETTDEFSGNAARLDPLSFLQPGARSVILGDPGSGKSTLLRFLSLAGISKSLQERYGAKPDIRLPIPVILRRYADELKSKQNLSLIDFILESVQADFNLKGADLDFFEYYLETGQAILLFDGLDELPNSRFKEIVRNRIQSLITSYPGNTAIVTSRIVGYENPFRFAEEFSHYRLTKLQLPEIEQFVNDWYRVRVENERERNANVEDLIRILRDDTHAAIRELAENPLLLTIVALVHRIDAVLPDERVVLYQKCTETLLNTWHTWKFREEIKSRGKVERRNKQRMEAIASWMHCQSMGTGRTQRAVVPSADLAQFLTKHIAKEKPIDPDNDPEDLAEEFLDFVKKRAGLLIEVGDAQYSFVHLTFQEYLTSTHIITTNEKEGASGIWATIKDHCSDSRWNEVIRLLVASLRANESQQFLVERILFEEVGSNHVSKAQLLGGLLLDGVEPAEERYETIIEYVLRAASKADDAEPLRHLISILRACLAKDGSTGRAIESLLRALSRNANEDLTRTSLVLLESILNSGAGRTGELTRDFLNRDGVEVELFRLLLTRDSKPPRFDLLHDRLDLFWTVQDWLAARSPQQNLIAAAFQAVTAFLEPSVLARRLFFQQLLLSVGPDGPFNHFNQNLTSFATSRTPMLQPPISDRGRRTMNWAKLFQELAPTVRSAIMIGRGSLFTTRLIALCRLSDKVAYREAEVFLWQRHGSIGSSVVSDLLVGILSEALSLVPLPQWSEALRTVFLPSAHERTGFLVSQLSNVVLEPFISETASETQIYTASSQLIFDSWLRRLRDTRRQVFLDRARFEELALLTRRLEVPALRIAHCIRDAMMSGDDTRLDDNLVAMVESGDRSYQAILGELDHFYQRRELLKFAVKGHQDNREN
jgi:hypothetical protein